MRRAAPLLTLLFLFIPTYLIANCPQPTATITSIENVNMTVYVVGELDLPAGDSGIGGPAGYFTGYEVNNNGDWRNIGWWSGSGTHYTVAFNFFAGCPAPGTTTVKIRTSSAEAGCGGPSAEATAAVDTRQEPSGGVNAWIDDEGILHADVNHHFPNSTDGTIFLHIHPPNAGEYTEDHSYYHLPTDGVVHYTKDVSCSTPGDWKIDADLYSCETVRVSGAASFTASSNSVAVAAKRTSPGTAKATVTYEMPKGSSGWSVVLEYLPWYDEQGNSVAGSIIQTQVPSTRTGQLTFDFATPTSSKQLFVRATAWSCAGGASNQSAIECCSCGSGGPACTNDPVSFGDGNMRYRDADPLPALGDTRLSRTYDSNQQIRGAFGLGWTSLFDSRLAVTSKFDGDVVLLTDAFNEARLFKKVGSSYTQSWPSAVRVPGTLILDQASGEYRYRAPGSRTYLRYQAGDGRFVGTLELGSGRQMTIAYDAAGLPLSATDSWTYTSWSIVTDPQSRHVTSIFVDGQPSIQWVYQYDTGGKLVTVQAPGALTYRTYEYSGTRLSGIRDGSNRLIESHDYDANGFAINSTGPSDEIAAIEYNLPGPQQGDSVTRITAKTGNVSEYLQRPVGDGFKTIKTTGGCASCGARDAAYVYDEFGRAVLEQNADGYVTRSTYTDAHLTQREQFLKPSACDPATDSAHCRLDSDALSVVTLETTSSSLTSTYTYGDLVWPDRPTVISTTSVGKPDDVRTQTQTFDPVSGDVTSSTTTGWTGITPAQTQRQTVTALYGDASNSLVPAFDPAGSFNSAWMSLPQPSLMRKSIDGPRTDVQDVTSFVYYPIDSSVPADLRGRLAAVKNAAGHITRYEGYDVFGNATRIVDANGVARTAVYDALGRLSSQTVMGISGCDTALDPLCGTDITTLRSYDGAGPVLSETKPNGGVTVYEYDSRARVSSMSRGPAANDLRERLEYSYDINTGKRSQQRIYARENGAWVEKKRVTYSYDLLSRLSQTQNADGTFVAYRYDPSDRLQSVRDENHSSPNTFYEYDPAGRMATTRQTLASAPAGSISTLYTYDVQGNLTSVTDPNGNVTQYLYDDFGQLLRQQSPVSGETLYSYDSASDLLSTTDARGATTSRSYDALGRVSSSVATVGGQSESVAWTYDAGALGVGRLSSMTDVTGSTAYTYERRGLLAREQKSINGITYTSGFGYDPDGNRSRINYPSGRVVDYTFDYADRPLTAVAGSTSIVNGASYLPFGPAVQTTFGNGTTRQASYDNRYRVLTNALIGPTGTIASYTYGYDNAGNITSIHDAVDPTYNRDFAYDDLNRLITANSGSSLWGAGSYSYDAMGNMLSMSLGSSRNSNFQYVGTTPKLSNVTENGVSRSVAYDAVGNESVVGNDSFSYTPANHMEATSTAAYAYDGRGIRTITTSQYASVSGIVTAEYSGLPLSGATVRLDGAGKTTTTAPDGSFTIDQVLAGNYMVEVTNAGFDDFSTSTFTLPAQESYSVGTLALIAKPASIVGRVVDSVTASAVVGATVQITNNSETTQTSSDGSFTLSKQPGTYTLSISDAGHTSKQTASFVVGPEETYDSGTIQVDAYGSVVGTVIRTGGASLSGATVTLNGTGKTANTAGDGTFTITGVIPASYTVTASKTGFDSNTTSSFSVGVHETASAGTISLNAQPATISGSVLNSVTNAGVAGATVLITGTSNSTTTASNGSFTLTQNAGSYTLTASANGYVANVSSPFTVSEGQSYSASPIALDGFGRVLGRIVSNGNPLAGATVTLNGPNSSATSGSDGTFTISNVAPGTYTLTITKANYASTTTAAFSVSAQQDYSLGDVSISALPAVISGTITNSITSAPVSGATVLVTGTSNSTTTSANGTFTLSQGAGTYTLTVSATGYITKVTTSFTVTAGQQYNSGTTAIDPGATVSGFVVNGSSGAAIAGALVTLDGSGKSAMTAADGSFTITNVAAGTYTLTVTKSTFSVFTTAPFTVAVGQNYSAGTISLSALPATIRGTIVNSATQAPVSGATVLVTGSSTSATTGADGKFVLSKSAGSYTLTISKTSFVTKVTSSFSVTQGQDYDTGNIQFDAYGTVSGTITDGSSPLNAASVSSTTGATATTNASGQYSFLSAPGAQTVSASKSGYNAASSSQFTLAANGTQTVNLTLTPMTVNTTCALSTMPALEYSMPATITARLTVSSSGSAISGQTITFTGAGQTITGVTNASGYASVTITPTAAGTTSMSASFAGSGSYNASNATVSGVTVAQGTTIVTYTGKDTIRRGTGATQTITAALRGSNNQVFAGRVVTFNLDSSPSGQSATATTDADGIATATMNASATGYLGPRSMTVTFAGDSNLKSASDADTVTIFADSNFVLWGGNTTGAAPEGATVTFYGPSWPNQVTGGDKDSTYANFTNSFVNHPVDPTLLCQADRSSTSSPALTSGCWNQSLSAPSTADQYFSVKVTSSLRKVTGTSNFYGNIGAVVVIRKTAYSSTGDGTGTVYKIVRDGRHLYQNLSYTGPTTLQRGTTTTVTARFVSSVERLPLEGKTITFKLANTYTATGVTNVDGVATASLTIPVTLATGSKTMNVAFAGDVDESAANFNSSVSVTTGPNGAFDPTTAPLGLTPRHQEPVFKLASLTPLESLNMTSSSGVEVKLNEALTPSHHYSLYSPELSLLSETEDSTASAPAVKTEYIWFGGQPVAQIDNATGDLAYYFNDHLGTPQLQTDSAATVIWRAEYEPFGKVQSFRAGSGRHQPLRFPGQEDSGGEEKYNIFRWYRAGWGRYTQMDPLASGAALTPYGYVLGNPVMLKDTRGQVAVSYDDPQYYPVPHQDIPTKCDGKLGWGCTPTWYKTTCDCHCSNGLWKAAIGIKVLQEVYYTSDYDYPSVSWIITEELKHVVSMHALVDNLKQKALFIEQTNFGNKWACTTECAAFKIWADFQLATDGYLDDKKPWFHPNVSENDGKPTAP
jgi:RHS repeat-associated protein